jgi:hypothetical protein
MKTNHPTTYYTYEDYMRTQKISFFLQHSRNHHINTRAPHNIMSSEFLQACDLQTKSITKKDLEHAIQKLTPKILHNLYKTSNYLVRQRIKKGIRKHNDLLTLLRRVLRKNNRFIVYKRYSNKGKTAYKYSII